MKRQIHPTIKAHLLRSGFYSLLLLAFCVIPFALGQRSIIGRNPVKPFAPAHPWFGHSPLSATGAGPAGLCQYAITQGTDTIVPGDTDTGNHTDDGDTFIALPFSFSLYDQIYNGVNVDSNGRLDFVCVNEPVGYQTACLPAPPNQCPYDYTIFGMWQDMRTDIGLSGCANFPGGTCGIFTSVSGVAPNRIFNIEWRAVYFADNSATANFEVRLYENDPSLRFDVIYGVVQPGGDHNYVSGVQGAGGAFTQYFCDPNPPTPGSATFTCEVGGGTPTPTPTASPTSSPSSTPTATPGGSCPPTITESTSQEIVSGNSVACNNGFGTTENHYWRAFDMGTFTGGQEYDVTSVSFGIELAQSGDGTGQPLTVNLYANHGSPFPGGDWQSNLIATSGLVNIPDQSLTVFTQTLTATVAAGTLELVMEVTTPDGTTVGNLFFIGSNPDPETGLSYLSAADCGVVDPTPVGDLGFPDMHIVFNVDGTCPGGTPTPTPTPSVTPSPTPTPSATPSVTPTPSATPTVTPTPSATPGGCVFGFGYWKTHPQAWPVTELQLGNVTYTQDQLLSIMHEPVRGNGLVSLAHHLIAAKLNVANGADPSCIQQTIADADALIGDLVVPPVGDGYLAPRDVNALKDTLEDYNEGHLCAPSCDNEGSPTPSPSPQRIPRHPPVMPQHHRPPR